jgi:hypothetical protein
MWYSMFIIFQHVDLDPHNLVKKCYKLWNLAKEWGTPSPLGVGTRK